MARFHCTPVSTTKRQGSSPTKKAAMLDAQGGVCPLCGLPMVAGEALIDEHMQALGLGGSNDPGNRCLVHEPCADLKTNGPDGDRARIDKAKAQQRAVLGFTAPKRPIRSRPMPQAVPRNAAFTPLSRPLPERRRPLFAPGA